MPEYHFGVCTYDSQSGRLQRAGREIPLQEKPAALLALLLEQPGELVTREHIAATLWPETHVALADNLNTTVSKLRAALHDKAANPLFIETVPRRGYRFIAPLAGGTTPTKRVDPEAQRHYDQGRFHLDRLNPAARLLAKDFFDQAVQRAPNCHLGYAGQVEALLWQAGMQGDALVVAEPIQTALAAALRLGPNHFETVLAQALHAFLIRWDYPRTEQLLRGLITESGRTDVANSWYAAFLLANGRFEEAHRQLDLALTAFPLSQTYHLQKALAFYLQEDRTGSEQQLQNLADRVDGGDGIAHWMHFHHFELWPDPERAVAALQKALTAWGFPIEAVFQLETQRRETGMAAVRRSLLAMLEQAPGMCLPRITLHAALNETDAAFALIETGLARRDWNLCYLAVEPRVAALRGDRRFASVLQRLHTGYLPEEH